MEKKAVQPKYQRILLKLSGEALQGDNLFGIDAGRLGRIAEEIAAVIHLGVQVALVVGGGNLIRGADLCVSGIERVAADQMGMLATVVNGLALRDAFLKQNLPVSLLSAFSISGMTETYDYTLARERLAQGKVIILVGGTGNPLVTTDSAAALRGIEIGADVVVKATKVDAVCSDDPIKNPEAKRYTHLSYDEVLEKQLGVMDLTSILLCREAGLPIRVFNMNKQGGLKRIALGEEVGTLIDNA